MNYEEDFVTEESVDFNIEDKRFKYKPTTADDELNWADEYIEIIDGKTKQNIKKITQCKIRNLIEVPYGRELINKIIDVDKEWKDLSDEEKLKFIGKLKPNTFDKIIRKINEIDSPSKEIKKN
ncbi:MAG: hypothetical protein QQN41_13325, partial [Nitrosopumilus sp.]